MAIIGGIFMFLWFVVCFGFQTEKKFKTISEFIDCNGVTIFYSAIIGLCFVFIFSMKSWID